MSVKQFGNFGELAIRSPSSLDEESNESEDKFSTIDLNGGTTNSNYNMSDINGNSTETINNQACFESTTSSLPVYLNNHTAKTNNHDSFNYTSFGEPAKPTSNENGYAVRPNGVENSSQNVTEPNSPSRVLNVSSNSINSTFNSSNTNNSPSMFSINLSQASATSMLSSASEASTKLVTKTATTLESLKQWSKSAYKCTKQIVSEKMGKTNRTVDPELEASIDHLRDLKRKYEEILSLSRSLTVQFYNVLNTQKALGDSFADLAQKSPELNEEFNVNAETQKNLAKYADTLLNGIKTFSSNLNTLCTKTIEDTLLTIRNYEAARLEYDANRFDLETLQAGPQTTPKQQQISVLQRELVNYKEKYERLKKDVAIKMKFLDENRVKVMKKQLVLFHSSIAAYFTGNQQAIEATMKQFNLNGNSNNSSLNHNDDSSYKFESFLEEN